jgi:hypothetical protein
MTTAIVTIGIVAGTVGGYAVGRVAAGPVETAHLLGALPVLGATAALSGATVVTSLIATMRAMRNTAARGE